MKLFVSVIKRSVSLILALCVVVSLLVFVSCDKKEEVEEGTLELNVYNWGEYIDDGTDNGARESVYSTDVIKAFEKYYEESTGKKVKVNYSNFENNESLYTKLKMGGTNYDVICPSDYMINRLIKEDMLEKLTFDNIPNYRYIDNSFKGDVWQYDPTHEYSVPYLWGTVGIVYNSEYVMGNTATWDILWNEEYKDKILMFNNPRDTFAIALSKLATDKGVDSINFNSNDLTYWDMAYDLLQQQKPLVQAYVTDEVFNKMESNEAWIAPCYYGDALVMMESNDKLKFTQINNSIANKYVDAFCIPKGSQNKELAEAFINYMCTKEIAFANASFTGYSTPHIEVANDNTFAFYQDPYAYPSESRLENAYLEFLWLEDATQAKMDDLWGKLKKDEIGYLKYIIIAVVVLIVVALIVIIVLRIKKSKENEFDYDDDEDDEDEMPVKVKKPKETKNDEEDYDPIIKDEDKLE